MTTSLRDTRSAELYARALQYLPGGVNSPVRAMRAIGRDPIFIERGAGAEITDADGNTFIDYVCSWGPLILGHAQPDVLAAIAAAAELGTTFGAPTAGEVTLAEEISRRVPGIEMVRMTSSGTEAAMTASASFHGTTTVFAVAFAGTPGLDGMPCVASPLPAWASIPSTWP